jgi:hypothetical protein
MKWNHLKFIKILNYYQIKKIINHPIPNIYQVDFQRKILKKLLVKHRIIAKNQITEYHKNQFGHN